MMLNQYQTIIYRPEWIKISIKTINDKKRSIIPEIYPTYPVNIKPSKISKTKYPYVNFMVYDTTQYFKRQEILNMNKDELKILNSILMYCDLKTFGGYSMYSNKALKLFDQYKSKFLKKINKPINPPPLRRESTNSYNTKKTKTQINNEQLLSFISKGNIITHYNKYI